MRPLDGYPTSFGNQKACIVGVVGPDSYTQLTVADPVASAGGQVLTAPTFGFKFFDIVLSGTTDSGRFRVDAIPTVPTRGAPQSSQAATYRLRWTSLVTASVGGQAQTIALQAAALTDLSGETVRLMAFGPK